MKKIITSVVAIALLVSSSFAQLDSKLKKDIEKFGSYEEMVNGFVKMLEKDFTESKDVQSVVGGKSFTTGELMIIGISPQIQPTMLEDIEKEMTAFFKPSTWKFGTEPNTINNLVIKNNAGETNTSYNVNNSSGFYSELAITNLNGISPTTRVFQSKANKNKYLISFPLGTMPFTCAMELIVNAGSARASATKATISDNASAAVTEQAPVANTSATSAAASEVKNKATNAVKGKLGKLF